MGFIDPNPTQKYSLHPWKDDLKALSRMLEREIPLPHLLISNLNHQDISFMGCEHCRKAYDLRQKYELTKSCSQSF